MTYLPDINVWIALAVAEHIHFKPATAWFQERVEAAHDDIAFRRVTQMGFLRLLTRSTVMGSDALTPAQAWDFFDKLRGEGRLFFADEPSGLESNWRSISVTGIPLRQLPGQTRTSLRLRLQLDFRW